MTDRRFRPLLAMLPLLLQACAPGRVPEVKPQAVVRLAGSVAQEVRLAEIRKQIAKVCPVPLTDAELERAAAFLEAHASDAAAIAVVGDLSLLDEQTRVCRSLKVTNH